jgi:pyridoxine 5-phosphate synthase
MTNLSVNLNKIALLRNARNAGIPSVVDAARVCIEAGAQGITVHPRPDGRHIRYSDVYEIADLLKNYPGIDFNIEGNPFPDFLEMVRMLKPHQCTLVPDAPEAFTSDHGWNLEEDAEGLRPIIEELRQRGIRVALFMDGDSAQWPQARALGADRVELYTEPYARAFERDDFQRTLTRFASAAGAAQAAGLGVNAGHDLNLNNLGPFCRIAGILEVSIGHALISDAFQIGLRNAVGAYLRVLAASS